MKGCSGVSEQPFFVWDQFFRLSLKTTDGKMTGSVSLRSGDKSAVDAEDLSRDKRGCVIGQEEDRVSDLFGVAETTQRCLLTEFLAGLIIEYGVHLGVDHAGGDAVDADPGRTDLLGQCFCKADNGGFGSGVGNFTGSTDDAPHGRNGDDVAAVAGDHGGQDGVREVIKPADVRVHDKVPFIGRGLREEFDPRDAGVIDEYVNRTECLDGLSDCRLDGVEVTDIDLISETIVGEFLDTLFRVLGGFVVTSVEEGDLVSGLRKPVGCGSADPAGPAGDETMFAILHMLRLRSRDDLPSVCRTDRRFSSSIVSKMWPRDKKPLRKKVAIFRNNDYYLYSVLTREVVLWQRF